MVVFGFCILSNGNHIIIPSSSIGGVLSGGRMATRVSSGRIWIMIFTFVPIEMSGNGCCSAYLLRRGDGKAADRSAPF